jgi:hypothetical protein
MTHDEMITRATSVLQSNYQALHDLLASQKLFFFFFLNTWFKTLLNRCTDRFVCISIHPQNLRVDCVDHEICFDGGGASGIVCGFDSCHSTLLPHPLKHALSTMSIIPCTRKPVIPTIYLQNLWNQGRKSVDARRFCYGLQGWPLIRHIGRSSLHLI